MYVHCNCVYIYAYELRSFLLTSFFVRSFSLTLSFYFDNPLWRTQVLFLHLFLFVSCYVCMNVFHWIFVLDFHIQRVIFDETKKKSFKRHEMRLKLKALIENTFKAFDVLESGKFHHISRRNLNSHKISFNAQDWPKSIKHQRQIDNQ